MLEETLNDCISYLFDNFSVIADILNENKPHKIFRKIRNGKKYKKRYLLVSNPVSDLICDSLCFSLKHMKNYNKK